MNKIYTMDADDRLRWNDWLAKQPEIARTLANRLPPDTLYLHLPTGLKVSICGYGANGKVKVDVARKFNDVPHDSRLYEINPDDLMACDSGVEPFSLKDRERAESKAVDPREFARFFVSGVIATVGNLGAVWLTRSSMSYHASLVVGLCVGMAISFLLAKFFVFRSKGRTHEEMMRFVIVYGCGLLCYWGTAVIVRQVLSAKLSPELSDMGGAFMGAGVMMLTGYFGHRFFTYRNATAAA